MNHKKKKQFLQGEGWKEGEVREKLAALIKKHSDIVKKPEYVYNGPQLGILIDFLSLEIVYSPLTSQAVL